MLPAPQPAPDHSPARRSHRNQFNRIPQVRTEQFARAAARGVPECKPRQSRAPVGCAHTSGRHPLKGRTQSGRPCQARASASERQRGRLDWAWSGGSINARVAAGLGHAPLLEDDRPVGRRPQDEVVAQAAAREAIAGDERAQASPDAEHPLVPAPPVAADAERAMRRPGRRWAGRG